MPKKIDMPSDQKAHMLLDAVEDRKAVDPVLLDVRGKTLITDFFLITTGTSNVHIRAISEHVQERADELLLPNPRTSGQEVGEWILLDFGDVVLHVMSEEARERYKLEQFWTTPQPKGALPPTPDSIAAGEAEGEDSDEAFDDEDLDDEEFDDEDSAFFDEADQELEPIEEEDDDLDTEGDAPKRSNGSH